MSHILQAHCSCGAGVVGDKDEREIVDNWVKQHSRDCGKGFVDSAEYTHSLSCPGCGERFYGREFEHVNMTLDGQPIEGETEVFRQTAQEYAVALLNQHYESKPECRPEIPAK